jgi:hypothetical protein
LLRAPVTSAIFRQMAAGGGAKAEPEQAFPVFSQRAVIQPRREPVILYMERRVVGRIGRREARAAPASGRRSR